MSWHASHRPSLLYPVVTPVEHIPLSRLSVVAPFVVLRNYLFPSLLSFTSLGLTLHCVDNTYYISFFGSFSSHHNATMITRITLIGAALLGLSSALPNAAPQVQYNTASVNTSGADKPSATAEVTPPSPIPSSYGGAAASHYVSPAFVPHGQSLKPSLSQQQTNGNSPFGTFQAPKLPPFLTGGPLPQGFPWGSRTAQNTDPYTNPPNTGVTRYYNFDIAEQTIAPDGVERQGFLINGQFPGPTIEANWGDWIEVTVNNQLASEGTTLHWHGLLQTATPYFDGVPSVQMCPIAPGGTFTYRFKADLYGTSW